MSPNFSGTAIQGMITVGTIYPNQYNKQLYVMGQVVGYLREFGILWKATSSDQRGQDDHTTAH